MLFIDQREVTEHPDIPDKIGIGNTVMLLPAADYLFQDYANEFVGIERSEVSNLVQKLRTKELEKQLRKCAELYKWVILLVEDVYDSQDGKLAIYKPTGDWYKNTYTYDKVLYRYLKSVEIDLARMGIEIVHSPCLARSLEIIKLIYENRVKPLDKHMLFTSVREVAMPSKITANPAVPKLLSLVPRLSEKSAVLLLHKFDSIWNVIHASDKELMEVEGVGKGAVKNLRESLGHEG